MAIQACDGHHVALLQLAGVFAGVEVALRRDGSGEGDGDGSSELHVCCCLGCLEFSEIPQVSCVLRDFPSVVCELRIGQCESVFEGALQARGLLSLESGLGVLYVLRTLGNAYGPLLELHGGKIVQ